MADIKKTIQSYPEIYTLLFYVLLATLIMFPVWFRINTTLYGGSGDADRFIWRIWLVKQIISRGSQVYQQTVIQAPFGAQQVFPNSGALYIPGALLSLIVGEVGAYNLLVFLLFIANSYTMFALARHLRLSYIPSIVAGIIFAYSPYALDKSMTHLVLHSNYLMPLLLISLLRLRKEISVKNIIFVGGVFALAFYTFPYFAYLGALIALTFYVVDQLQSRFSAFLQIHCAYLTAVGIAVVAVLPGLIMIRSYYRLQQENPFRVPGSLEINREWAYVLANRPWEYISPPEGHPLYSVTTRKIQDKLEQAEEYNFYTEHIRKIAPQLWNRWYFGRSEQLQFIGYIVLGAAVCTMISWLVTRKQYNFSHMPLILSLILVGFLFSQPPHIPVGPLFFRDHATLSEWLLPTPTLPVATFLPEFRDASRVIVLIFIGFSLLTASGLTQLEAALSKKVYIIPVAVVFCGFVLTENLFSVPVFVTPKPVSEAVRELKEIDNTIPVAEYPLWGNTLQYLYNHPAVNLVTPGNIAIDTIFYVMSTGISASDDPLTYRKLAALGVEYVLYTDPETARPSLDDIEIIVEQEQTLATVTADPVPLFMTGSYVYETLWYSEVIPTWDEDQTALIVVWNPYQEIVSMQFDLMFAGPVTPDDLIISARMTPHPDRFVMNGIALPNPLREKDYQDDVVQITYSDEELILTVDIKTGETYLVLEWTGKASPVSFTALQGTILK